MKITLQKRNGYAIGNGTKKRMSAASDSMPTDGSLSVTFDRSNPVTGEVASTIDLNRGTNMTALSSNGVVAYDVANGGAWVKFNRPDERNCMSPTLNRDMIEVLDTLEFRDDFGVLALTGEGTARPAGMDLEEDFRETGAKGLGATRQARREAYGWWGRLRWYRKPTIAMGNGWCFGGGLSPGRARETAKNRRLDAAT